MPRTSPRRLFLYLLCLASGLVLAANVHHALFTSLPLHQPVEHTTRQDGVPQQAATFRPPAAPQAKKEQKKNQRSDPPVYPDRPWYMVGGAVLPKPPQNNHSQLLFPEETPSDRIPEQLMFIPPTGVLPPDPSDPASPLKKILLWNGASSWGGIRPGRGELLKQQCPVSTCVITTNRGEAEESDLILFKDHFSAPTHRRREEQVWLLYLLECPLHTQVFSSNQRSMFNWTATYRSDSTIVAPYERWQYHHPSTYSMPLQKNYAANKTKQVAWFVSNCGARNGRLQYAQELAKYIGVDIYGACGSLRCPRTSRCFSMLDTDYKFYLAFENSNCKDYITEKFFVNGLGHDVLPIVMGARPEDYARSAPHHSYIHVDEFSGPKALAEYLLKLDKDDEAYNQYFKWKGTGEFINTRFFCRVCALMHNTQERPVESRHYSDINQWWRGEGTCSNSGWRKEQIIEEKKEKIEEDEEEDAIKEKGAEN